MQGEGSGGRQWAATAFAALVAAGVLVSCHDDRTASDPTTSISPTTTSSIGDKYKQTWTVPYDRTTCVQFKTEMSSPQRWAMAADMLTSARNMSSRTGLPTDAMITDFEGGLHTACVIDTATMAEVSAELYMSEPRFRP